MPIGFGTPAPAPSGDGSVGETPSAILGTAADIEPAANDTPSVVEPAPASTVARSGASLDSAIRELARDAAALRDAVARVEIAGAPADAGPIDDAPLLDTLVAAQAREQRVRDDTVELTRGLARITTQSALLQVRFTEAAAGFLPRLAASGSTGRAAMPWIALGVALAGVAAVVATLAFFQARENARQLDRLQQALVQSISENAQAQASAVRTLEARMRELTSREAAIVAAIKAAATPPPRPAQADAAPPAPAKSTAPARNAKRAKAAR